jgi:hypothetical protein
MKGLRYVRAMVLPDARLVRAALFVAGAAAGLNCGSGSNAAAGAAETDTDACFPDGDGVSGGYYTFDLTVDDTGFSKNLLNTQNDAQVTLTLTNLGTTPHGFAVGCTSVTAAYPDLPPSCPTTVCFPSDATIPPLAPGASATIVFSTPTVDSVIYPFTSGEPSDSSVPGLNNGQWSLM